MNGERLATLTDSELVLLVREGNMKAYAELWSRYSKVALTVARGITNTFDPQDLVAEAYTKILASIEAGGGPQTAFRAYLVRSIYNIAAKWARPPQIAAVEDLDIFEDPRTVDKSLARADDVLLAREAFHLLPPRWQEVLWYLEVEQLKPYELGSLLGISPNAVAALSYRAREGLRQAWIQVHLNTTNIEKEHVYTIERLGAYSRHALSRTQERKVSSHLAACAQCRRAAAVAAVAASQLDGAAFDSAAS